MSKVQGGTLASGPWWLMGRGACQAGSAGVRSRQKASLGRSTAGGATAAGGLTKHGQDARAAYRLPAPGYRLLLPLSLPHPVDPCYPVSPLTIGQGSETGDGRGRHSSSCVLSFRQRQRRHYSPDFRKADVVRASGMSTMESETRISCNHFIVIRLRSFMFQVFCAYTPQKREPMTTTGFAGFGKPIYRRTGANCPDVTEFIPSGQDGGGQTGRGRECEAASGPPAGRGGRIARCIGGAGGVFFVVSSIGDIEAAAR